MSIDKDKITLSANAIMHAFSEDNLLINREAIPEVTEYQIVSVDADTEYQWDFRQINHAVRPLTLFAYASGGVSQGNDIYIRIRDASTGTLMWELDIANRFTILGNAFVFEFPFMVVDERFIAGIESSIPLNALSVFGKKVFLHKPAYAGTKSQV